MRIEKIKKLSVLLLLALFLLQGAAAALPHSHVGAHSNSDGKHPCFLSAQMLFALPFVLLSPLLVEERAAASEPALFFYQALSSFSSRAPPLV